MIEVCGVELVPAEVIAALPPWLEWGSRIGYAKLPQATTGATEKKIVAGFEAEVAVFTRGPNGRVLCGWCREEVPAKRQRWCSDLHQAMAYALTVGKYYRWLILDRDNYRCQACDVDHPGWRIYDAAKPPKNIYIGGSESIARAHDALAEELGIPSIAFSALLEAPWEIDHILAVTLGGTDAPENLRTLCRRCHGDKSARDAAVNAKAKRIRQKHLGGGAAGSAAQPRGAKLW